jgi:Xaa-Pro dipeptidase
MKIKEFCKILTNKKIDVAFFVNPDPSITYFTQVDVGFSILCITSDSVDFYLNKLDKVKTSKQITIHKLNKNWKKELSSKKWKIIGINKDNITLSFFEQLKLMYPKSKLVDISKDLIKLRKIKTSFEIKKLKEAGKITSHVYLNFIENYTSKKFPTEQSISFFLEKKIKENGHNLAFPTIVGCGKNTSIPHHKTSTFKIKKGFIQIDFGAVYQNYNSDMSRVLYVGKPNKIEKEKYELLLNCQQKAIKNISKNKTFKSVCKSVRNDLGKESSYFIHSLGHGVGIEIHEAPRVNVESEETIKEGMVFTIEPGIYYPNKFGLRIEDTLSFSSNKTKRLTKATKELIKL